MQTAAIVENGIVSNVIMIDPSSPPDIAGLVVPGDGAHFGVGYQYTSATGFVAPSVSPTMPNLAQLTMRVSAECQRRIYAVASQNAQMNMTAYVAAGLASEAEKSAFADSLAWVSAMRGAYAALVAAQDQTFADDGHWPPCPADASALAARF